MLFLLLSVSLSVFGRVGVAVDERAKVKVRVYQNTGCIGQTLWSGPISCLLSGRGVSAGLLQNLHAVRVCFGGWQARKKWT